MAGNRMLVCLLLAAGTLFVTGLEGRQVEIGSQLQKSFIWAASAPPGKQAYVAFCKGLSPAEAPREATSDKAISDRGNGSAQWGLLISRFPVIHILGLIAARPRRNLPTVKTESSRSGRDRERSVPGHAPFQTRRRIECTAR